ncbi:hypothetical protein [Halorussus halophilus]|uniref:hypothetical protein n=1 Tax=Halorussus halophilus TaxID=2650975 RepID=UPI001301715D|nr:hypothetical protein [Halorussus halophilus]
MGVRPPTSDSGGTEAIEFGIAELAAELDRADASFPATGEEIVRATENPRIDYDANGHAVALADALAEADSDHFESQRQLLNELHPVFEEYRTTRSPSLVERMRAMLPY